MEKQTRVTLRLSEEVVDAIDRVVDDRRRHILNYNRLSFVYECISKEIKRLEADDKDAL